MANTNIPAPASSGVAHDAYALFTQIDRLFGDNSDLFFQQVLNERLRLVCESDPTLQDKNIATKLMSPFYYAELKRPLSIGTKEWHQIEQDALFLFDDWAQAWCGYKIWKLKKGYHSLNDSALDQRQRNLSHNEADYFDSVIDCIEQHKKHYYTLHCQHALTLPDAIVLINLSTFVWQHKWYEMLYEINQSSCGTHFILATQVADSDSALIVASAKINHHTQAEQWLYFSPFFQTDSWQLLATKKTVDQLSEHGLVDNQDIPRHSSAHFENSLWQKIVSHQQCCEIIRLTVSGNQSQMIFYLYLAQKRLMEQLFSLRYKIAFVVIEQPLMIQYYLSLGETVFSQLSTSHVSSSEFATYKGLWFIQPLNQELARASYKSYKKLTIRQLKKYRNHGHKPHYA
ncbi:acyl-homoserine-lactone synthase [Vibrio sp. TRT 29B02]|uniref:acyl-homoserine-lactone synthase n=1 Tax=Vibrio sp. TRT 29B02 TaxID=3418508 RepID=UPI003CF29D1D